MPDDIKKVVNQPRRRVFQRPSHPILGETFLVDDYQVAVSRERTILNGLTPDKSISDVEWLSVHHTPCGSVAIYALPVQFVGKRQLEVDPDCSFKSLERFERNCDDVMLRLHTELALRGANWEFANISSDLTEIQDQFSLSEIIVFDWGLEITLMRASDRLRANFSYSAAQSISTVGIG